MNSHTRSALLALAAIVSVAGCSGKNGANGANGTDGTNGTNGVPGVSSVTADLAIKVVSVTTSSPIAVRFTLKDKRGYPVDVNGIYSVNTVIQPRFGLAYTSKDAAGNVLPYTVLTNSSSTTKPTLFQPTVFNPATAGQGTLVENGSGAGDYTYTFPTTSTTGGAQAVAYDATKLSATHVVWIQATRQTNLDFTDDPKGFSAANQEYDYVPAGGTPVKREVVLTANCSKCHDGFRPGNGSIAGSTFHGGGRVDAGFCNICHNPGRTSNPSADSKVFVHRLHGSAALQPANLFHGMSVTYPQDVRNCGTCHAGAAQGDQYKTNPSILACGSCHDYVSFSGAAAATCTDPVTVDATGLAVPCNHIGGTQANDAACSGCHSAASITTKHAAVVPPDANNIFDVVGGNQRTNAAYIAAGGYVPPGAAVITNDVLSVSRNASKQPVVVFKFKKSVNGATATDVVFNTYAAGTTEELMTGFVGAPSVYFAFAVPQDGIAAPADFNATVNGYLRSIWNGTATGTGAGTMTGPDANGYYTVTLTGVVVPDTATMLTGGIGYSYDLVEHAAAHADRPARISDQGGAQPGVRDEAHGRPHRPGGERREGGDRRFDGDGRQVHRPPRHRGQRQVQRLPRGARRRAQLPRRPAQRRADLLVLPHPEPHQQRLVGQLEGLPARAPRRQGALHAVHLAPGLRDRGLLGRRVPVAREPVRGVPRGGRLLLHGRRGELAGAQPASEHGRHGHLRRWVGPLAVHHRGHRVRRGLLVHRRDRRVRRRREHDARRQPDHRRVLGLP